MAGIILWHQVLLWGGSCGGVKPQCCSMTPAPAWPGQEFIMISRGERPERFKEQDPALYLDVSAKNQHTLNAAGKTSETP